MAWYCDQERKSWLFPSDLCSESGTRCVALPLYPLTDNRLRFLINTVHATALYTYESTNEDELAFNEGDILTIVDSSEMDWWKAERNGLVFVVPAAYLEPIEG